MRKYRFGLIVLVVTLFCWSVNCLASELIDVQTFDGYQITGKLDLPEEGPIPAVVVFVPGTGPCTYDNHRKIGELEFNYFDLFADELTDRGIAFFRYNTRGTSSGPNPPYYDTIDREIFATNLPINHARDVENIVRELKEKEALQHAKIILLGWSEGTVIASIVAERDNVKIDALFLAGYENDTIPETVEWQLTGGSSMIFYRKYFDTDGDGIVSKLEFAEGPEEIKTNTLQGTQFEQIDLTGDGFLTAEDFKIMLASMYQQVSQAFNSGDDDWVWNNYFRISTDWYQAHAQLEPNRTRLVRLDLPIYIFHGVEDANVAVEGVYDVQSRFEKAGKDNLHTFIFAGHDHDLNYLDWPLKGMISDGFSKLFEELENLADQ